MAVAPRAKPEDHFSPAEWAGLTTRSNWRGLWLVVHCWAVIGVVMIAGALWPITIPLGIVLVGTRQLGLFVLMHDAAHAHLHRNRRVNDWVGHWLCSSSLRAYRPYHLQHHRYVQQTEDPDLVLSAPFPVSRQSFARKALRDLTGRTFVKQRFGHLVTRVPGQSTVRRFLVGLAKERRFLTGNAIGFALFAAAGWWWLWVALWLVPMATWFQLVYRIRNIAEHSLIAQDESDPLRQARTIGAGWLERVLVAPYWVNYHCEHHLFTNIPCWKLPRAHALLARRGMLASMEIAPGYRSLLRRATAA